MYPEIWGLLQRIYEKSKTIYLRKGSFRMGESEAVKSICGLDCCEACRRKEDCGGCIKAEGHPFGGKCIAAEIIKQGGFEAFEKFKKN